MKTIQTLIVFCVFSFALNAQVSFKLSSSPGVANDPAMIATADVNGDGKLDMICPDYYGPALSVLTNNGSGGFVLSGTYTMGNLPSCVAAADVNGDGKVDLICVNNDGNTLTVLTNSGSGGFVLSRNYAVNTGAWSVTAADVNGDGKVDLITANWNSNTGDTLTVLTNDGSGGFVLASSPVTGTGPMSVAAADVNGDGKMDLISANRLDSTLSVLTNNGSGGFVLSGTYHVGSGPILVKAADVNGDGKVDLISANWGESAGNTLTVLTNNGSGGFVFSSTLNVGKGSVCVAAADVNGDGKVDLISANTTDSTLSVLTNNGSGGFVLATNLSVGNAPNWVTAADINGDGKVDLISANSGNNTLTVWTNATVFPMTVPLITSQPQSQTNFVSATVTFQVGATSSIPVSYQWLKNSTKLVDGGNLSGAHTNTLTITGISYSDAAIYSVIVSNTNGSVASSNAVLTVIPPRPATGVATLTGDFVTGVSITDGGGGYTNIPLVRFIGGGGSGAGAYAVVSNGVVTGIIVTNAGFGYANAPVMVIDPPFISNPIISVTPMSFLAFSNLTVGGTYQLQQSLQWYWTNRTSGFMASNTIYTQMVAGAVGSGNYRLALNPAPAQAFATPQVVNGFVVGATVTSGGSGYVTSPAVSIIGGHGTNATAVASIAGGVVTSIGIINPGSGYTNTPTVEIAPPPAAAVSPAVVPVIRVDCANLAPYDNYQIQYKPDITAGWINWNGGLFSPTAVTNSQYLFITNTTGYFRLQYMP